MIVKYYFIVSKLGGVPFRFDSLCRADEYFNHLVSHHWRGVHMWRVNKYGVHQLIRRTF